MYYLNHNFDFPVATLVNPPTTHVCLLLAMLATALNSSLIDDYRPTHRSTIVMNETLALVDHSTLRIFGLDRLRYFYRTRLK